MYTTAPSVSLDHASCASDPIHIKGLIQNFGVCLVLDEQRTHVMRASENAEEVFGQSVKEVLGKSLSDLFDPLSLEQIHLHLAQLKEGARVRLDVSSQNQEGHSSCKLDMHLRNSIVVLELEKTPAISTCPTLSSPLVQDAIEHLQASKDLTHLCSVTVDYVQLLTGYDRVMIYQFDENWNGHVIAESLSSDRVSSYMGLWFPSSDIPPQARQLFYENWVRIIPDVHSKPVRLLDRIPGQAPVDLTLSILRSPAPIHIEYLQNMQVAASLSISIRKDGRLWGLIACHHETPKLSDPNERMVCEFFGKMVSALTICKETFEDHEYRQKLKEVHKELVGYMKAEDDFVHGLVKHSPNLLDLTAAVGAAAALYFEGNWTIVGKVPRIEDIDALVSWLKQQEMPDGIFHTNHLPRLWPEATRFKELAAGVLAISIPKSDGNFILWFRPELIQTVKWAGNPDKNLSQDPKDMRLHPRKSFSLWKEEVKDASLPWRATELEAAANLRRSVIEFDLERQFKRERLARAEADASNRMKEEVLAVVSHDLRNPLRSLSINIGLVKQVLQLPNTDIKLRVEQVLSIMETSAKQMNGLIQDLIDMTKLEAKSKLAIEAVPSNAQHLLEETLSIFYPLADSKKQKLIVSFSGETQVVWDPKRIQQVISNLVGNALKFSPSEGNIFITVDNLKAALRFSVKDEGPGIPEYQLEQIFERFWQGKRAARDGLGLGLAISRGIIAAHGGKIWAKNNPDGGAELAFEVPNQ